MLYRLREFVVSSHPLDPRESLAELARLASEYSLNLDGLVSKDWQDLFVGGHAVVCSGILDQKENPSRILGGGPLGGRNTTKVSLPTNYHGSPSV